MRGLMMDDPLLISSLLTYAERYHGEQEIVSRTVEGGIHRYTYAEAAQRARQLANVLKRLGIHAGDRVATMAWNGFRHYELFFGITGIGAVCHTVNPRLFHEQIRYIINHAKDRVLFADLSFVPLLEQMIGDLPTLEQIVILTDRAHMPATALSNVLCYEDLLTAETDDLEWPLFDERTASSLCYTSGTSGNPKGVLHSHRSIVLCSFVGCMTDVMQYSMHDVICPITPMYHGNSWGSPYGATMAGAKLVLPGANVDGATLHSLMESEGVTMGLAVPTVWQNLLDHVTENGKRFTTLQRALTGGTAPPQSMIRAYDRLSVEVIHAWGMTEISPTGVVGTPTPRVRQLEAASREAFRLKQGHGVYGVQMKLRGENGNPLPHDGTSKGELLVRGPLVVGAYFDSDKGDAFDESGWLRTGDIATIDKFGYMTILDRHKDMVKSGGEWISSIEVENAAMGHPSVREAAVIGVPHPKWGERPLLVVVPRDADKADADDILGFLATRVAKWQVPDDVVIRQELPHTATGKVLKSALRNIYKNYSLPTI